MDDLLNEFLTETSESIDVVDVELVKLEQDPNNKEVLDNIFRLVHTIKGTCGFLGLPRLESVAHASENVLGKFRDGELQVTEHAVTVILESLDRIKEILAGLEATETEPEGDDTNLIDRLDAIAEGREGDAAAPAPAPAAEPAPAATAKAPEKSEPEDDTLDGEIVDPTLGRALKEGEVSLEELEAAFAAAPGPGAGTEEAAEAATPSASSAPSSPSESTSADAADHGSKTLFERIGGDDPIAVAAHFMASRVFQNVELKGYFAADADQRKMKFHGLLLSLFKDDVDAADAVAKQLLVADRMSERHFSAFQELSKVIFAEVKMDADEIDDALMAFELIRETLVGDARVVDQAASPAVKDGAAAAPGAEPRKTSQSIRVSVDLLEDLMTMVSELVLTRNQLLQITRNLENNELAVPLQRLSQTTTELQENVMKTRMQPIGNAWAKLPRIVRDLTVELDKKIDLKMLGAETELDRQVLELIKDPLTHMVRNSADHGVETPAERMASGKSETGTIVLNAYHEGGHIILEIKDDGRGISAEKLKSKILQKGLASEAELADMSDAQIQKYIFHPGFSTAEQVTNVSGRGVGMDVVRSNIEKIGGTIDMNSVEGKGTTFAIKIPLTLAIVAALIVEASGDRYAIPQISVLELVRASSESEHRIETIKDTPVLRLRNRLLPLVYLNDIIGEGRAVPESERSDDGFIVVAQVGAFNFGIVVDQVFDTEEIVVKPVAPILKDLSIYSGNTILGDGSVIMILDPNGIASAASANMGDMHEEEAAMDEKAKLAVSTGDSESMLVFRAGTNAPKAVPLALVARLEDVEIDKIERQDGRDMVQYRGSLMPLVKADPEMAFSTEGRQPVLVFTDRQFTMGLAVDEILDIVDEAVEIKLASDQRGMIGSAVVAGKATAIIDVAYYLQMAFAEWLATPEVSQDKVAAAEATVLLIDDSDFFRSMLKPVLAAAGYQVRMVNSARAALRLREEGMIFDLIISDIEMPDMSGFEFAEMVKTEGLWKTTPLVALSGLAGERDIERGRASGFDDYVAKFDKPTLLKSLAQQLKIRGDAA